MSVNSGHLNKTNKQYNTIIKTGSPMKHLLKKKIENKFFKRYANSLDISITAYHMFVSIVLLFLISDLSDFV